jgi:hypothetical protein
MGIKAAEEREDLARRRVRLAELAAEQLCDERRCLVVQGERAGLDGIERGRLGLSKPRLPRCQQLPLGTCAC